MANTFDQMPSREALISIARDFHGRGWMAGTAGNLSCRAESQTDCFWITSSGQPKGSLEENDLIMVNTSTGKVAQQFRDNAKPSAETSIHQSIYKLYPEAHACFHVHTVDACLAARRFSADDAMRLPSLEMIKGLDIWEQTPEVDLPLFDNILDVTQIAQAIEQRFKQSPPRVPALMIRDHGMTVWGNSLQQAYNRVEIVEFIMSFMARL